MSLNPSLEETKIGCMMHWTEMAWESYEKKDVWAAEASIAAASSIWSNIKHNRVGKNYYEEIPGENKLDKLKLFIQRDNILSQIEKHDKV